MGEYNYTNANVKFLREQKKISQVKLSEDLNIDQSTLAKWENNTRQITLEWTIKIANYFKVFVGDFISKDLRLENEMSNNVKNEKVFQYKDEDTGLTIEIILPNDSNWDDLSNEEKKQYIDQAMDSLYEAKKDLKKNE